MAMQTKGTPDPKNETRKEARDRVELDGLLGMSDADIDADVDAGIPGGPIPTKDYIKRALKLIRDSMLIQS